MAKIFKDQCNPCINCIIDIEWHWYIDWHDIQKWHGWHNDMQCLFTQTHPIHPCPGARHASASSFLGFLRSRVTPSASTCDKSTKAPLHNSHYSGAGHIVSAQRKDQKKGSQSSLYGHGESMCIGQNNWASNFCLPLHAWHHEAAPQSIGAKWCKNPTTLPRRLPDIHVDPFSVKSKSKQSYNMGTSGSPSCTSTICNSPKGLERGRKMEGTNQNMPKLYHSILFS